MKIPKFITTDFTISFEHTFTGNLGDFVATLSVPLDTIAYLEGGSEIDCLPDDVLLNILAQAENYTEVI
jgi:hypothetical protein